MTSCFRGRLRKLDELTERVGACSIVLFDPANVYYFTGFKGGVLVFRPREEKANLLVPVLEYLRALDTLEEEGTAGSVDVIAYTPYRLPGELKLAERGEVRVVEKKLVDAVAEIAGTKCDKIAYDRISIEAYKKLGEDRLLDVSREIALVRAVKEPCELERIGEAVRITEEALAKALEALEPGVSESEIAGIIEAEMRNRGADDHAFPPIVAFGSNTIYPHATPSPRRRLADGQPVLIDIGAVYKGYCSDMTRTIDFGGVGNDFTATLKAVMDAVNNALDRVEPGARIGDVDLAARKTLESNNLARYFIHSLGHGVGIEVHEYPRVSLDNDDKLVEGMVITIEPGVYIPGRFGVRVEELVLVTSRGPRLLTRFPRELWL